MQPAMTVEQWSQWLGEEAQTRIEDATGDVLVLCRNKADKRAEVGGTHHATAAAALHNKPFGFTRADVEALRERTGYGAATIDGGYEARTVPSPLASLADRIEALLAPAEVTA